MIDASHYAESSIIFARTPKRWFLYDEHLTLVCLCKVQGFSLSLEEASRRFSPIDLRVSLYPSGEFSAALKSPFQPASRTSYLHAASINLCPSPSLHVTRPCARKHALRWKKGNGDFMPGFSGASFKTLFSAVIAYCCVTQDYRLRVILRHVFETVIGTLKTLSYN